MDGSIGVRWPVVQHVEGRPSARLPDAVVEPHLLPALEDFRLVLRQVSLHGEGSLRQIDGRFQLERHSVGVSQMIESFHYRERDSGTSIARTGAEGTCLCGLRNALPECEKIGVQFLEGERLRLSAAAVVTPFRQFARG